MSHRWKVDLSAGGYFPDLATSFDGEDIALDFDNDPETAYYFFAYSNHLDCLTEQSAVMDRLVALELLLNGALRLADGGEVFFVTPIRFTEVWNLETKGRALIKSSLPDEAPFDEDVIQASTDEEPAHPAARLIALARGDEGLRILLLQVGLLSWPGRADQLYAWSSLYKAYDTVRTLASQRKLNAYEFVDKSKIEAFTAACNSMSILGLSARHGFSKNQPPKRVTTSLEEATRDVMAMATVLLPEDVRPAKRSEGAKTMAQAINPEDLFGDL